MSAVRFVRGGVDAEAVGALWAALTGRRTGPLLLTTDREEFAGSSRRITQALDDIDVVLRTSGSTDGRGHLVGLSLAALAASADATLARLGGPGQWVTSLPTTAVAGFQVVLRSVRAGIEPVVHEAGKPLDAGLRRGVPHYLSLVPTQLVRALASDPAPLRAFDAVLVGGAALDPATAERAASTGFMPLLMATGLAIATMNPAMMSVISMTTASAVAPRNSFISATSFARRPAHRPPRPIDVAQIVRLVLCGDRHSADATRRILSPLSSLSTGVRRDFALARLRVS